MGGWRKIHCEEIHDMSSSTNIRVIKSRGARLVERVAQAGEMRKSNRSSVGKANGRCHLGDLHVNGKIILKWIMKKQDVTA